MSGLIKQGSEFRINTTTAGTQYESAIRALPDGRLLVVWSDTSNGTDVDVRARIITADGVEAVPEFIVATTTTSEQYEPAVATFSDGRFVVVWSDTANGTDVDVRARIFHGDGAQAVGEFVVSSGVAADQFEPTVTALADGRFVVAWADNSGGSSDIRARIFNADGTEAIAEFVANSTTANSQYLPGVLALDDGRFVVSWTDDSRSGGDTSQLAIRARVFNADGSQAVPEFLVNTTAAGSQIESTAIELADGRVVIAWTDYSDSAPDQQSGAVRARIFNADFTPVADDFVVNATVLDYQALPAVAALPDGGFVVAWEDLSQSDGDTSDLAVRAQRFDAAGARNGDELVVNTATASAQFEPDIAALGDGRIAVTWTDFSQTGGDASSSAIRGQVIDLIHDDVPDIADVLWQHDDGSVATANHNLPSASNSWRIVATGDFDGDRDTDILWRHDDGAVLTWELENGQYLIHHNIAFASSGWDVVDAGDFDADGDADILWRHLDGAVVTWEMESGAYVSNHNIEFAATGWEIDGLGDFDRDGDADILWRHRDGAVVTWEMENGAYIRNHNIEFASTNWQIQGTGDFDNDGDADMLWHHADGMVVTWEMEAGRYVVNHNLGSLPATWDTGGTEDFDSDGDSDILWRDQDGRVMTWELQGGEFVQSHDFGVITTAWQIKGTGEFDLV